MKISFVFRKGVTKKVPQKLNAGAAENGSKITSASMMMSSFCFHLDCFIVRLLMSDVFCSLKKLKRENLYDLKDLESMETH